MDKVIPKCPVFYECGGCQLQDVAYPDQLRYKQEAVEGALKKVTHIRHPKVLPTIPAAHPWNYRTRITLHCDRRGRVGFYRKRSHDAIEFDECPIAAPGINERLQEEKAKIDRKPGHYEVRIDDGEGFTQINPEQNAVLQQLLGDGLSGRPAKAVVELYCGNGNFSFVMAPHVGKLYGCDTFSGSIDAAIARAKEKKITNVQFVAMSSQKFMKDLLKKGVKLDGLMLDPPRRGAKEVLPAILELMPQWICYISCNPVTFASDLKVLLHGGYTLESCQPVDMFPQTDHVETISWLGR